MRRIKSKLEVFRKSFKLRSLWTKDFEWKLTLPARISSTLAGIAKAKAVLMPLSSSGQSLRINASIWTLRRWLKKVANNKSLLSGQEKCAKQPPKEVSPELWQQSLGAWELWVCAPPMATAVVWHPHAAWTQQALYLTPSSLHYSLPSNKILRTSEKL